MEEKPSDRVIDQRTRNRIMEALHTLADGDTGVRNGWPDEYFESFYTWIPHHDDGIMRPNSAITVEERAALTEVSAMLDAACDATPAVMNADELIETGWPIRIQPIARKALQLMAHRGRFSEDRDELEPSIAEPPSCPPPMPDDQ
jgi:hypothetical protein